MGVGYERAVAVTSVGLACALGDDPQQVARKVAAGETGLRPHPPLVHLPSDLAGVVAGPDLTPFLKRRKDAKLLARPSELALAAAGRAIAGWPGDRADLGLFLGVGREPPDDGESEPALVAACRDGKLDPELLAGPGRDRYPPLLPLKTLPNMALAHVSIHLGIMGENGAWTGGGAASLDAVRSAWWAVVEGRCPAALAGGADSQVDLGSARDRLRMGATGPPGEGAAVLLLEPWESATARGAPVLARLTLAPAGAQARWEHWRALGDCGAADGALALALAVAAIAGGGEAKAESSAILGNVLWPVVCGP